MAFPYKPKPKHSVQKKVFLSGGIAALIIISAVVIYTAFPSPTIFNDHSIMVDPTKEKQSLFTIARVTIQNTGTTPLTNLTTISPILLYPVPCHGLSSLYSPTNILPSDKVMVP